MKNKMTSTMRSHSVRKIARHNETRDLPRDAMHAAASGYDFGAGEYSTNDDFTGPNTMIRTGSMEPERADHCGGVPITVKYVAHYTFEKPRPQKKG